MKKTLDQQFWNANAISYGYLRMGENEPTEPKNRDLENTAKTL